ncbi:hypothetical protein [Holzapfeliella floricola]|uniref:hypothetical protein n=1 Tax=Holzapfeliella floricola TaxID=679249 RepID=UPI000781F139|nr:hypothetical protein [Holzapfeliella floricola]
MVIFFLIVWIWMAYVIVLAFTIRIAKMKSSYRLGIPSTITFLGVVTIGYLSVFLPEFQQSSLNLIVIALAIFYCIQVVSLRRAVRKLDFDQTNYRKKQVNLRLGGEFINVKVIKKTVDV